jgi:hypothetical protein
MVFPDRSGFVGIEEGTMRRFLEIRSYTVRPGTRDEFRRLVVEESLPMLRRWEVEVVAFGPSPHDDVSCYLMRAYESLEHRERSQEAFYGSAEWREGPRDRILALIESYATVVIEVDAATLAGLRR